MQEHIKIRFYICTFIFSTEVKTYLTLTRFMIGLPRQYINQCFLFVLRKLHFYSCFFYCLDQPITGAVHLGTW